MTDEENKTQFLSNEVQSNTSQTECYIKPSPAVTHLKNRNEIPMLCIALWGCLTRRGREITAEPRIKNLKNLLQRAGGYDMISVQST